LHRAADADGGSFDEFLLMITPRDIEQLVIEAETVAEPGLFGIFCETDLECEMVWPYLVACVEGCPRLILNTPQREVTICNGGRIRVFCATWRIYVGLEFNGVLLSDHMIGDHVKGLIKFKPKRDKWPNQEEPEEPLRFGL
jgi:hypothetical protein